MIYTRIASGKSELVGLLDRLPFLALQHLVNHTKFDRLIRCEVTRTVDVLLEGGMVTAGGAAEDVDHLRFDGAELATLDFDVGRLALVLVDGLLEHDGGGGQGGTHARLATGEEEGSFAKGGADAKSVDGRLDVSHGVVDGESFGVVCELGAIFVGTSAVDVQVHGLGRVLILQVKELSEHELCDRWYQWCAYVHNALVEEVARQVRWRLLCCIAAQHRYHLRIHREKSLSLSDSPDINCLELFSCLSRRLCRESSAPRVSAQRCNILFSVSLCLCSSFCSIAAFPKGASPAPCQGRLQMYGNTRERHAVYPLRVSIQTIKTHTNC